MDATGRPDVIPAWLKSGRKYEAPPKISDLNKFSQCWWEWWNALQPEWRDKKGTGRLSRKTPEGETWSQLYRGGANGFLMIILTLSWWAMSLSDDACTFDLNSFTAATDEASWVLDQMLSVKTSLKRPSDDIAAVPLKKRQVLFLYTYLI